METFKMIFTNFMSGTEVSYNLREPGENFVPMQNLDLFPNHTLNVSVGEEPVPMNDNSTSNVNDFALIQSSEQSYVNQTMDNCPICTQNNNGEEFVPEYNTSHANDIQNFGTPQNINGGEILPIDENDISSNNINDILQILENPIAEIQVLQRMDPTENGLLGLQDMRNSHEYNIHHLQTPSRNEIALISYARNLQENNLKSSNPSTFNAKDEADKIVSGYYLDIHETLKLFRQDFNREPNPFFDQNILAMEYLKFIQEEHQSRQSSFQNFNFPIVLPQRNIQNVDPPQNEPRPEETVTNMIAEQSRPDESISFEDSTIDQSDTSISNSGVSTDQSSSEESAVDQSRSEESAVDQSRSEESSVDQSRSEESSVDQSRSEESSVDQSRSEESSVDPEPEDCQAPGNKIKRQRRTKLINKKRLSVHSGKRNLFERKCRRKIGDAGKNMERIKSLRSYTSVADKPKEDLDKQALSSPSTTDNSDD